VSKVLAVWADWFLFSESFITGLRTTFLRRSDSGVPPFHTLASTPLEQEEGKLEEAPQAAGDDHVVTLEDELKALPAAELERRCKHSGLSLRGGRAVMIARLLYADEEENGPRKGGKQDTQKKGVQGEGENGSRVSRSRAAPTGQWETVDPKSEPTIGWEQIGAEASKQEQEVPGAAFASSTLRIPEYGGALAGKGGGEAVAAPGFAQSRWSKDGKDEEGGGEKKKAKAEVVLPASKWTQEGGESDDDSLGGGQEQGRDGEGGATVTEEDDPGADARSSDSDIFEGAGKFEGPEATGASAELEEERR
jgi:hypothetical protein